MSGRGLPASTYRLQLSARFTFDDATRVCGYLRRLGVDVLDEDAERLPPAVADHYLMLKATGRL